MKTSHSLRVERESRKTNSPNFRRFWAKEPRHSETISTEKCYLYRSTRHEWHYINPTALSSFSVEVPRDLEVLPLSRDAYYGGGAPFWFLRLLA